MAYPCRMSALDTFHPIVRSWFTRTFAGPTTAQERGWTQNPGGARHAHRGADRLGQDARRVPREPRRAGAARRDGQPRRTRIEVVYVSPLKALSSDVQRTSQPPLAGIRQVAAELGLRRARYPHRPAHGRHDRRGARGDRAERPARPHHDPRVALPDAHRRPDAGAPAERAHGDRRRAPRPHARQAREPPRPLARPPRRARATRARSASASPRRCTPSKRPRASSSGTGPPVRDRRRRATGATSTSPSKFRRPICEAVATNEQWDEIYDRLAALIAARGRRSSS